MNIAIVGAGAISDYLGAGRLTRTRLSSHVTATPSIQRRGHSPIGGERQSAASAGHQVPTCDPLAAGAALGVGPADVRGVNNQRSALVKLSSASRALGRSPPEQRGPWWMHRRRDRTRARDWRDGLPGHEAGAARCGASAGVTNLTLSGAEIRVIWSMNGQSGSKLLFS